MVLEVIEHAISIGTFDYSVTFPGSARAAKFAPEASRETVNGFLTRWLAAKEKHIASSTFDGYRKLVTLRLIPALGDTMLVDLKRKAVRSCLRSALNDATEKELIELNPLAGWTYSRKSAPPKDDDVDPSAMKNNRRC